ncbi:oxoacyl-(acyl carrier protein) reductase [Moraxella macacae 0408225]|uniref:Oxoacyl-(Acyl carrier protein) reductase n=1 Tax=Moraxella macacae 0408225 TaxID=1230338 RepID=L2F7Z4_9GAMM|nr:YciK family oxidoreductase [Moraxella macacae]ELA09152.1 oxoacyl-(acyl carrier protein) reductase [Moraxella macacae 0408225]
MLSHEQLRHFQANDNCLANKNILVTGAGDGIGRAVALAYARYGATVLLLGKNQAKLESVYDEIEQQGGAKPAILPLDLEKAPFSQMQELAIMIEKEVGCLDGLLHNAGILGILTPLEMYDPITFEQVMKVNFTAPFMLTQALFSLLSCAKSGSVIFTSSGVAKPRAFWGAYALSKQGLEGMSDIFTQETQKTTRLRFNCINPGATRTQMRATAYPSENPNTLKAPEELLNAYIALMSDETIDVKGQVIDLQPKN